MKLFNLVTPSLVFADANWHFLLYSSLQSKKRPLQEVEEASPQRLDGAAGAPCTSYTTYSVDGAQDNSLLNLALFQAVRMLMQN